MAGLETGSVLRCTSALLLLTALLTGEVCGRRQGYGGGSGGRHRPEEGPYFRSSASAQEAQIGENVTFECDVGNKRSNVITWTNMTSTRVIYAGPVNILRDPRLDVSLDGRQLHIFGVTSYDTGIFMCKVETKKNPISLDHRLEVLIPPRVYPSPPDGNHVVRAGNKIDLTCHAEGSPKPKITWRRLSGGKRHISPGGEDIGSGPVYTIERVDRFDAGLYECEGSSKVGKPDKAEVRLQVIYAPIVTVKTKKVYAEPGQEMVTLECEVEGEPAPKVQWRHTTNNQRPQQDNQGRLVSFLNGRKATLQIRDIRERDYGNYECMARNKEGSSHGELTLTGEPQRPVILSSSDSESKTSYVLRWSVRSPYRIQQQKVNYWEKSVESGHNMADNTGQQLSASPRRHAPRAGDSDSYKNRDGRHELHLNAHEQHRLTHAKLIQEGIFPEKNNYVYEVEIPDLGPNRLYVAQVKATNRFNEGEWSEQFVFETSGKVKHPSVQGKSGLTSGAATHLRLQTMSSVFGLAVFVLLVRSSWQ